MKSIKFYFLIVLLCIALGAILIGCSSSSDTASNASSENAGQGNPENDATETEKETAESFYKGKKISFIVPYDPGGGYDIYARMMVPYLEEYTGAKIQIDNLPGAGGMRGVNELFAAPNDGLTIGIMNGSAMVTNQISEIEGARYKLDEFSYLGRIAADTRVLTMAVNTPYHSYEDIKNSEKPIILGATGLGGSTYVDAVVISEALGLNVEVIHGYDSVVEPAILRGEVEGTWGSLGSRRSSIEEGATIPVLQSGKERMDELSDVPTVLEVIEKMENPDRALAIVKVWDALNSVGRPVAAPPGIPEDRLAFLQVAFDKVLKDERFIADAIKTDRELSYASGEEMLQLAIEGTDISDEEIKQIIINAIKGEL